MKLSHIVSLLNKLFLLPFNYLKFKKFHYSSFIKRPLNITPKYISVGKNVFCEKNCRIEGIEQYNTQHFSPEIILLDGVTIQQNLHLTCATKITIGENTAIAANVSITDIHHPYDDPAIPIEKQNIITDSVNIGPDCKIYNNVVVLPGVSIGKHCTIGANSVVTHDIPDYSVAVGAPAKVIKRYNFETKQWEKVE